jgi:hypothetical protein
MKMMVVSGRNVRMVMKMMAASQRSVRTGNKYDSSITMQPQDR